MNTCWIKTIVYFFSSRVFLVVGYKLHTCASKLRCVPGITELFVNTRLFEVILLMCFGIVIFHSYCKIWFKTEYWMYLGHHWRVIRISDCSIQVSCLFYQNGACWSNIMNGISGWLYVGLPIYQYIIFTILRSYFLLLTHLISSRLISQVH